MKMEGYNIIMSGTGWTVTTYLKDTVRSCNICICLPIVSRCSIALMTRCFLLSLLQGYGGFFHAELASGSLLQSEHCNEKTTAVSEIKSGFAGQSVYFSFFFSVFRLCLSDTLVNEFLVHCSCYMHGVPFMCSKITFQCCWVVALGLICTYFTGF